MHLERYPYRVYDDCHLFEFESTGRNGTVTKRVIITPRVVDDALWNIALGDWDHVAGRFDPDHVADNGDTLKILGTVAWVAREFLNKYPDRAVVIQGSDAIRNRLYQMGIGKYISEIIAHVGIFGVVDNTYEVFQHGVNYDRFIAVKRDEHGSQN
jgi:hypothetical protein